MKTPHTPGPWAVTPGQNTIWASDGDLKVATVADLPWIESPATGRMSSNWQGEAANARLIAAAPDLLAVIQSLPPIDAPDFRERYVALLNGPARSAIAKVQA